MFLGSGWLRDQFAKNFSIPANAASELIEKLQVSEYIYEGIKIMDDGKKKSSVLLKELGIRLIQETAIQVAATTDTHTSSC